MTNNLAERCMGLIKDVILHRIRAYNSAALAEFVIGPFDDFFARKLMEIASSKMPVKVQWFDQGNFDIKEKDACNFEVRSGDNIYSCDTELWSCTCHQGRFGVYCKHLFSVSRQFGKPAPIDMLIEQTPEVKQRLAEIATGSHISLDFFLGLTQRCSGGSFVSLTQELQSSPSDIPPQDSNVLTETPLVSNDDTLVDDPEEDIDAMRAEALEMFDKATRCFRLIIESSANTLLFRFVIRFAKQMTTAARSMTMLTNWLANSFLRPNLRRKQIGMLPGGQRRRHVHLTGSRQAQPRGRPSANRLLLQGQRGPKPKPRISWK